MNIEERPEPPEPLAAGGFVRLRIDLSYDGARFAGWAKQPNTRTVQGELERGLATVLRLPSVPRVTCAGRTDTGVHARGQVAHVDIPLTAWDPLSREGRLARRLRGVLDRDVVVHDAAPAPPGFDARFSAIERRYIYRLNDRPGGPDPVRRGFVVWSHEPLEIDQIARASSQLLGLQDFATFCRKREGATTVRTLLRFEWVREGYDVTAHVHADAFCHSMVRALVGSMLLVGTGRISSDAPLEALAGRARIPGWPVAPAHGLTLEEVVYPDVESLAAQAERARRLRTLADADPNSEAEQDG